MKTTKIAIATTTSTTTTATTSAKFASTDIRERNKTKDCATTKPGQNVKIKGGTLPGTRRLDSAKEASMRESMLKWTEAQHLARPSMILPGVTSPPEALSQDPEPDRSVIDQGGGGGSRTQEIESVTREKDKE